MTRNAKNGNVMRLQDRIDLAQQSSKHLPSRRIRRFLWDQATKWLDVMMLILGFALFSSPWVVGFGAAVPNVATKTAGVLGTIVFCASIAVLIAFEKWELYIIVLASAVAIGAPFVLGLSDAAVIAHLAIGLAILLLASTRLWLIGKPG